MFEDKIGFMASLGFARMPAQKVVAELKELGYSAVEWTRAHFDPRKKSVAELKRIVDVTRSGGLAVGEVVIQQDFVCLDDSVRQDRIALTIETIEACAETGVDTVNLFTGPAPWVPDAPRIPDDISEGAAWQMVLDAYGRVVEALEKSKVHGAVEGVWGHLCNDYYTTRRLIDHFDSDYLGVNFDPSHDVLKGNFDTGWIVRQWGKKAIKHIHLKDAIGIQVEGKFLFPLLGEGRVPWGEMFAALDEIGYDGFMSIEFESFTYLDQILDGDIEEAARISMRNIRKLEHLAEEHKAQ